MTRAPDAANGNAALMELAAEWVRNTFDRFDNPDDDWPPTLVYAGRRGDRVVAIDTCDRDAAAARIEQTLSAAHATEAVWITACWIAQYAKHEVSADGAVPTSMRPSLHPERRECITMAHVTADSFELQMADLTRFTDRPPRLGPFTSRGSDLNVAGVFADVMRRGIG
jgi:hypothetical protein